LSLYQRVARRLVLVPPMPALKASEQDDDVRVVGSLFHSRSVFGKKEWKSAGWRSIQ
jgi:hypothetical protein